MEEILLFYQDSIGKGINLKDANKGQFICKDLKICQAVKSKYENGMVLTDQRIKLQLSSVNWNNLFWEFAYMVLF